MIKNILEYFEKTVVEVPEKTAVKEGEREITFAALGQRAEGLAALLRRTWGGATRRPIAVFLPKSIACVVDDLGIVYSGNIYMNLDVKTPAQRIGNILELVQPLCVLTDEYHRAALSAVWPEDKTILVDGDIPDATPEEAADIRRALEGIIDTDPLCLINTSGSTGTPKSVVLNHRSFIDFTEWAIAATPLGTQEVIGSLSPCVFDIYSFELCMMMAKASTIVVIPDTLAAFPARILQLLQEESVTFLFWVPTIMVNIANMGLLDKVALPALKMVWFAGEVFPTRQFNIWRRNLPQTIFINLYGPIEITLDCTYFIVDRDISDEEPIPIGFPCRNTDILILNEQDQPVAANEEGELCVRGSSLAMGYYNSPEKTAAAFVQNPLNKAYPELIYRTGDLVFHNDLGEIIFKGRKDTLVKHSGYRVELGEIEHVIVNTLQLVKNGCAVYDYEKKEIVFFYESEQPLETAVLRRDIGKQLPRYMIPGRFVYMELLPRNTNGKIDRLRLKELGKNEIK
ncbi:MAG: AMP-binding protein [Lawsonibacter sp.]|nr:AMP-binding protein [Lawsonibacter sp.]